MLHFRTLNSLFCFLVVSSNLFAQEDFSDRTKIWLKAMDSLGPAKKASPKNADSEQDVAWIKALQQQLTLKNEAWTEAEASEIYRRLCRLTAIGNAAIPQATAIEPSNLFPLKIDVQTKSAKRHPVVLWPAGTFAAAISPHFTIATQGSTKQAVEVARLCEQTYAVWKQVFFSAWSSAALLQQSLASNQPPTEPGDLRFQIVVFRNREGYVKQLQQLEPNVAVSTGYYSPKLKTVFCYWDEATSIPTLRHELTHQFFSQAVRDEVPLPEKLASDFWIVEGLALYMESIQIEHAEGFDIATIGGWDASRLQPARYRRLHDETWIPWDEFRRANNERFRTGSDIKQWYSQAAGLTHFWMDGNSESREAFLNYVRYVYRGEPNPDSLREAKQDNNLVRAYDQFLMQPASKSALIPPTKDTKEIVLSRCPVTSERLLAWPESKRTLDWLDVSFSKIDDRLFLEPSESSSKRLWDIRRLNVESTSVTDASLPWIAKMQRLEELDLSRCGVSDAGLEALRGNKTLKTLWLTGNPKITDQGLSILASLPKLEMTDVSETSVTEGGWKSLVAKSPRLRRKKS